MDNQPTQTKQRIAVVEDHYDTPTLPDNLDEITIEAIQKDLQGSYHTPESERTSRYEFARQTVKLWLKPKHNQAHKKSQLAS
jgi:dTDP-4-dehydrorhamnose reductase